jgi:hypothetical protein
MHAPSYARNPRIKLNLQSGEKQQYGIAKTVKMNQLLINDAKAHCIFTEDILYSILPSMDNKSR